jgi:hypothetical protein
LNIFQKKFNKNKESKIAEVNKFQIFFGF